nr:hypothetical protein [Candidatus Dojkabacteria bacterium]
GLSESLVDDVVGFYWSAVRKELSNLDYPRLTVTNLGTFKVRYNRIPQIEEKYNYYINNIDSDKMTFNKHSIQNTSKEKLEKLKALKEEMNIEWERKQETKLKRTEYVTNKNLEEQRKNSGGSEE